VARRPVEFGPWQTVWKRHRRLAGDGTWHKVLQRLLSEADAAGELGWQVSVDSTVNRAHQHATNLPEPNTAQGAEPESQNPPAEPADHAIGRSRGGLSTKVHQLVDPQGLPLVVLIGPGQGATHRCCPR
jgi:transposase